MHKLEPGEEIILKSLREFMIFNTHLKLLDLSHTGIGQNLLAEIGCVLRRSKALLVLDLSGNNSGITEHARKKIKKRIRAKEDPFEKKRLVYLSEYLNNINKNFDDKDRKDEKIIKSLQMRNISRITNAAKTNKLTEIRTF